MRQRDAGGDGRRHRQHRHAVEPRGRAHPVPHMGGATISSLTLCRRPLDRPSIARVASANLDGAAMSYSTVGSVLLSLRFETNETTPCGSPITCGDALSAHLSSL